MAAPAQGLRAGFATADLTPPVGIEMGGFGYNLGRTGDAVHDALLARAVVVERNGTRMAVVACDLGGMNLEITGRVRRAVEEKLGIPGSRVMVAATHTHSAPVVANWTGIGKKDPRYLDELPSRIVRAIADAASKLQPVTAAYGEAPVEGVARNREYPNGPVDPAVRVLAFTRASGELAGFIANYSVHPVVMAERTRLFTGDLAGVSVNQVMGDHPGAVGIFLQGSCGDINPVYAHMPQEESLVKLDLLAGILADDIRAALKNAVPFDAGAIAMDTRRIVLPLVPPEKAPVIERLKSAEDWLALPDLPVKLRGLLEFRRDSARAVLERFDRPPLTEKSTEIQAAVIGDVVLAANPGETFLVFGQKTAERLKGHRVMVAGYVNDYVGYIPAPDRYLLDPARGLSYPAYVAPWFCSEFRYREDVGEVLAGGMVALAQDVIRSAK
jgi:hypothetical protein